MSLKQFFRSQTAGLKSSGKKRTIAQLESEAFRDQRSCKHVSCPKPPTVLFGSKDRDTAKTIRLAIKDHVKNGGRKPDPDAQLLLCSIASFPINTKHLEDSPILYWIYCQWTKAVMTWCKSRYGNQLHKVIQHTDERYPHLHIWATAKTIGKRFELGPVNAGFYAQRGLAPQERMPAFKQAWRGVQNDFWWSVSRWFGFARLAEKPEPRLPYRTAIVKRNKQKENKQPQGEINVHEDLADTFEMLPTRVVNRFHP